MLVLLSFEFFTVINQSDLWCEYQWAIQYVETEMGRMERKREREIIFVCVCVWEREREASHTISGPLHTYWLYILALILWFPFQQLHNLLLILLFQHNSFVCNFEIVSIPSVFLFMFVLCHTVTTVQSYRHIALYQRTHIINEYNSSSVVLSLWLPCDLAS